MIIIVLIKAADPSLEYKGCDRCVNMLLRRVTLEVIMTCVGWELLDFSISGYNNLKKLHLCDIVASYQNLFNVIPLNT
jgi:hypothetical protein